jgi:hypothetical protein
MVVCQETVQQSKDLMALVVDQRGILVVVVEPEVQVLATEV